MEEEKKKVEETPKEKAEEKAKTEAEAKAKAEETIALLAELDKAGVSKVEELTGKLTASREAGNLANQLGTARSEIAELKTLIESNQRNVAEHPLQEEETDLNKLMEKSVDTALDRREKKQREANAQIQQAANVMWGKIYNHPKYNVIKDLWEKKFENPSFSMQIQSGILNPLEEFHNTLNEYWEGIAQRSVNTIKTLQGKGDVVIPHVEEEGQIIAPATKEEKSESRQKLDRLQEISKKRALTSDEEIEALEASLKG